MDTLQALSLTLFLGSALLLGLSWWLLARSRKTCQHTQELLVTLRAAQEPLAKLTLDRRWHDETPLVADRRHSVP